MTPFGGCNSPHSRRGVFEARDGPGNISGAGTKIENGHGLLFRESCQVTQGNAITAQVMVDLFENAQVSPQERRIVATAIHHFRNGRIEPSWRHEETHDGWRARNASMRPVLPFSAR